MKQYQEVMQEIMDVGHWQHNRTGVRTKMIPSATLRFNLRDGFPAVTTKKLFYDAVKGELLGFLRGYTNAAQFRALGCNVWDKNANITPSWVNNPHRKGEDDLGYIYSRLWTDMPRERNGASGKWNQIDKLIDLIRVDPQSRRMIVNSWHPEVFDAAALPPCHVMFQVIIEQTTGVMHMSMYQRSCDFFLGVPFNIASYATLLEMLARRTGYKAGQFTWFGTDVHIYENHMEQVAEQLSRKPMPLPVLNLMYNKTDELHLIDPHHIQLEGYTSHSAINGVMAA